MATALAAKPSGPPQLDQIAPAGVLRVEAVFKLQEASGVILDHIVSLLLISG